jgi:hypothetical protein
MTDRELIYLQIGYSSERGVRVNGAQPESIINGDSTKWHQYQHDILLQPPNWWMKIN